MNTFLISIPADPTRNYAIVLRWPGFGYYNFASSAWVPTLVVPGCIAHFQPDPADPGQVYCYVPNPQAGADVVVQLVAVDGSGHPIAVIDREVLEAPIYPPSPVLSTATSQGVSPVNPVDPVNPAGQ